MNIIDNQGKRQGLWKIKYPEGHLWKEGHFIDDAQDGIWRTFHSGNRVSTMGKFIKGIPTGCWDLFDGDGKIIKKILFII